MAKSKSGGTRSYIRGRVGADVYSIGKDAKGKKQQVVRSLAETVANPRTAAQMAGRMIMTTVMQALSAMKPIIDHSFDNVAAGQPSLSEFIARNYALVKADIAQHPDSGNIFGLNLYQEKGAKAGAWVIAAGSAVLPAALIIDAAGVATIAVSGDALTVAALKSSLGLSTEEYFTLVGFEADGDFGYVRVRINPNAADDTVITSANVSTMFAIDGNITPAFAVAGTSISVTTGFSACNAIIVSRKTTSGYIHNDAQLSTPSNPEYTAGVALPTYPKGSQRFLNGGAVAGESEVIPDQDDDSVTLKATALTVAGESKTIGGMEDFGTYPASKAIGLTFSGKPTDGTCKVGLTSRSSAQVGAEITDLTSTQAVNSLNMSQTFSFNDGVSLVLVDADNKLLQRIYTANSGD